MQLFDLVLNDFHASDYIFIMTPWESLLQSNNGSSIIKQLVLITFFILQYIYIYNTHIIYIGVHIYYIYYICYNIIYIYVYIYIYINKNWKIKSDSRKDKNEVTLWRFVRRKSLSSLHLQIFFTSTPYGFSFQCADIHTRTHTHTHAHTHIHTHIYWHIYSDVIEDNPIRPSSSSPQWLCGDMPVMVGQ